MLKTIENKSERFTEIISKNLSDVTLEDFEFLLDCHDWYYSYSDDHRWWSAGWRSWQRIKTILDAHTDDSRWQELCNQKSPFNKK